MTYELKHKVFFHEETHKYFATQEALDTFVEKLEAYKERKEKTGEKPNVKKWVSSQSWRYDTIDSVTTKLGKVFPFTGADFTMAKAWLTKIANKKTTIKKNQTLVGMIEWIDHIEEHLNADLEMSQRLGTEAHEEIQKLIEDIVNKRIITNDRYGKNPYTNSFLTQYAGTFNKPSEIISLIKNIEELLPQETPVGYWDKVEEEFLFTGMWDGLYKMKNGEYYLIDIKTGSELKGDKLLKVQHQMNAYNCLIQNNIVVDGKPLQPTKHIAIEIAQVWDKKEEVFKDKVKLHEFKPRPASFFTLIETQRRLENWKELK